MNSTSPKGPVIGYLLKTFPKLSETFILNEMLELERQGLRLHIFSLRKPKDKNHHPAVSQLKAPVTYLPSLLPEYNRAEETALLEGHILWNRLHLDKYLDVLRFYLDRPEEKRLNEFLQGSYLAMRMEEEGISHLHVHFANVPAATAEIAQRLTGIPYSITAHAKDIYLTEAAALDRRIEGAEFVLTCTDYNRRYLESISTSDTPIYLSYHGIDLSRFSLKSKAVQVDGQGDGEARSIRPFRILSVGRFCEKKGFPYLLIACQVLKNAGIDFHCNIVGYGPLQAELEAQIADLGIADEVTLVGKLTQDKVIEQYRQADVFVLPCQVTADGDRDGIPNVLLEAMAIGIPVISTTISGITELVRSGENGLLVPEKDPGEIAVALINLATDRDLGRRLGQTGSRTVHENFTLERNVGQVKTLLLNALLSQSSVPSPSMADTLSSSLEALIR